MKGKKCKNGGGRVLVAGGNPNVIKEAKQRKAGGKVVGDVEGGKAKHRFDRARKSGGRVGADKNPFSSAKATTSPNKLPRSNSSK